MFRVRRAKPLRSLKHLGREGLTTATGLFGVGVGELEPAADEGVAIVEHHAIDVEQAFGIAHHLKAVVVIHFIVRTNIAELFKVHGVGHA